MSERFDRLIGSAVDDFHAAEELFAGPAAGPAAVRATVARRRRTRVTMGVLGALLIAVPIGAVAANPWGNNGPPGTAEVAGALGCEVIRAVDANLDADPALETAATVACRPGQILAVERNRQGRIVWAGVDVDGHVMGLIARPDAGVTATVVWDISGNDPGAPFPQEREYGWDGAKFAQLAGPTAFVPVVTDLTLTGTPLRLVNGTGQVILTVRNNGPGRIDFFALSVSTGHRATVEGLEALYGDLRPGASRSVTLTIRVELGPGEIPLLLGSGVHAFIDDPHPADNSVELEVTQ